MGHTKVFISYSHKDEKWLRELKTHLTLLERAGLIESWDDKRLKPGAAWEQEIEEALDTAKVAILLVSPHFFESTFISSIELPALLTAAQAKGTIILSLIITACDFEHSDLRRFQTLNPPDKPLDVVRPKGKQHQELKRVANEIRGIVEGKRLENSLPPKAGQSRGGNEAAYHAIRQPKHKFTLRWRHVLLPGLVGFAIGLICGGFFRIFPAPTNKPSPNEEKQQILPPRSVVPDPPDKKGKTVYMVGSGTVFRYLTASNFFKNLGGKDVPVLEGPTETGVELFGSTNPMTNLPYTNQSIVLVMAAEKQPPDKLRQYPGQPGEIYEIYLGADSLQVFYASVGERRDNPSDSDNFFLDKKRPTLTSADLRRNWGKGYDIYVGKPGSGTRKRWEEYLFGANTEPAWPREPKIWDIRMTQILNWPKDSQPRIYLGSEVLNEEQERIIADNGRNISRKPLTMSGENPDEVRRGLYLYGWIDTSDVHGNNEGYNLPKPVADILKVVFASLEGNTKYVDGTCLDEQRKYFHLQRHEDGGWVEKDPPPGQEFYRAETCRGRVEK